MLKNESEMCSALGLAYGIPYSNKHTRYMVQDSVKMYALLLFECTIIANFILTKNPITTEPLFIWVIDWDGDNEMSNVHTVKNESFNLRW